MAEGDAVTGGLKSLTGKKVAGIPVVYILGVVGVVAVYAAIKTKANPPDEGPVNEAPEYDGDVSTDQPTFEANPPQIYQATNGTVGGSTVAVPQSDSNDLWERRTVVWLAANGYSLDVATSAIKKYLNSDPLTSLEARARDAAVAQFGIPPETVPDSGGTIAGPVTTPAVKPASKQGTAPCWHTVMGTSDDSFNELAVLYYGVAGSGTGYINLIAGRNPGMRRTGIPKGTKVRIPAAVEPKMYRVTSAKTSLASIAAANAITPAKLKALNPSVTWPAKVGLSVRVR